MSIMERLRTYHAALAGLTVATFATGEAGMIHAWLGYAIALVILGRLAAAMAGLKQLGLARFYPQFAGLRLGTTLTHPAISKALLAGIAACLIAVTATGIHLDGGRSLGLAAAAVGEARHHGGLVEEAHEALANLLLVLVGLHILYLVISKRSLARFMLFLAPAGGRPAPP